MLKFTFVRGARAGTTLEVPQRWPIRLGRHPDNEVQFDAEVDRQVSTFHAEIRQEQEGLVLYDLGSSNGTFMRGAQVTRHVLSNGDEVTFGTDGPVVHLTLPGAAAAVAPTIMAQAAVVPTAPVQPVPAPVQPAPAPVQPAPVQPAPAPVQPTPTPTPAPVPVQPAPAPVQPAPAPVQPTPAPVRPPRRRRPARIWLLFIFLAVGMMLAAGAWVLGEIYRGSGGLDTLMSGSGGGGGGGGSAADPGALGRAWREDSDWLKGVDLLVSSAAAPTRAQVASRAVKRSIGPVVLRGGRDLSPVVLQSRIEVLPAGEASPEAREALRMAESSGAYVLGDSVVSILAPGGSTGGVTTLGSPLLVTLKLTPQQIAAAEQGWAGAVFLSAVGPQFIFGLFDQRSGTVTFSTRHLSSYAPAAPNPAKKETWSAWLRRKASATAKDVKASGGGWKPECEAPLVWSRKPDLKPDAKELKPNGCSAPGKRVQNAYNWWYSKDKHKRFHEKDNPSGLCNFKRPCNGHDRCWVKCGKPKHECDQAFEDDLLRAANVCIYRLKRRGSAELEEQRKAIYYWVSKFAAAPVGRAGNVLYKWAQQGACTCVFGVAGSWDLDKEALLASAPVVARNMARVRGGTVEEWEPRIRQTLVKLNLKLVFEESGRFSFSGRDPRGRSQRTRGQWRQQGNYIKLLKLRGSSLPSRTLKIVDGKLMLVRGASGMAGQLWVFTRR